MKSIFILSIMIFRAASAQEVLQSLQTEITQKNQSGPQYQVGDRIQLNVRVPFELSQDLATAQLKNPDPKNALDQLGWYLDPSTQVINGSLRFIVSPIKSGKLVLPELYIYKDETHPIAKTSAINIDVLELASPSTPPALLDTISISMPTRFIVLIFLLLLLLIFIGYNIYKKYFSKKMETKITSEIKVPPTPDHVIALRDLTLLYEQNSYSKETLKPIAFGVSQILKNFFSARFKVDAKESTTDEMLALLKQESVPAQDLKKIAVLFQNLDLIKFTELNYHQHFQKSDYLEFRDQARLLVDTWAIKGEQS